MPQIIAFKICDKNIRRLKVSFSNYIFGEDAHGCCVLDNKIYLVATEGELNGQNAEEVIIEMCFQLGYRVAKFKKMWEALKKEDYVTASKEMLDSNWHKQTPKRCEELAREMWN